MAEETNNQAPLTAREVAAANPELDQLRQIAFGTNYLDDIDAGTGTARFYSGFGMQPDYLNTAAATEQAVADAVAAEAEAAAAPVIETPVVDTGGEDQATGDSTDFNLSAEEAAPQENIGAISLEDSYPAMTEENTAEEILENLNRVQAEEELANRNVMDEVALTGGGPEEFARTELGLDYSGLDQEGQREVDEQFKATPDITPALDINPLTVAANIITGGITDIPFVGTAVQKASDYFTGDGNDSVASTTTPTMGDTGVDAEENQPNNIQTTVETNVQTPLEAAIGINSIDIPEEIRGDDETITLEPEPTPSFQGSPAYSGSDSGSDSDTSSSPSPSSSFDYESDAYSGSISNAANQAANPQDSSQGSSSGGGGKIVCTMMNDTYGFGNFRNKIWLRQSKDLAPEYQKGYHAIFLPLVKLSKTNIVIKKILEHIAVHRTMDIRQESRGKTHILGRVYRKVLEPICYLVGKYVK